MKVEELPKLYCRKCGGEMRITHYKQDGYDEYTGERKNTADVYYQCPKLFAGFHFPGVTHDKRLMIVHKTLDGKYDFLAEWY